MSLNSSDQNCSCVKSLNEGYPLPYPFQLLFSNPPLRKIDNVRIFGKPLKLQVESRDKSSIAIHSVLLKDNLVLGALWGALSGYCTGTFFMQKSSDSRNILPQSNTLLERTRVIGGRVCGRLVVAGLLFDFVEQHTAKQINHSRTNTMSIFGALVASSIAFPLCSQPLPNAVYTLSLLAGYLVGSTVPSMMFGKSGRD